MAKIDKERTEEIRAMRKAFDEAHDATVRAALDETQKRLRFELACVETVYTLGGTSEDGYNPETGELIKGATAAQNAARR